MKSPVWLNLKWSVLLLIPFLLLFLFSGYGCMSQTKAEAYSYAEDFYKRYITDTADTLGYPYDEDLARKWCTYARYPDENFFGPHILSADIYGYPLNMGVYYQDNGKDYTMNNADTLAELGEDGVQEVMDYAVAHWGRLWNVDFRGMSKEEYRKALLWYYSPYIKKLDYRSEWINAMYDGRSVVSGVFVPDATALYKAADGSYRVRGIGYIQYHEIGDYAYMSNFYDVSVGEPYWCYMEIGMIPCPDDGRAPLWEHGPWHICMYCRFSGWLPSENDEINDLLAMPPKV